MPLLTKKQLASELATTASYIQTLTREGKIPVIRIGHRTVRYDLPAVMKALKKGK